MGPPTIFDNRIAVSVDTVFNFVSALKLSILVGLISAADCCAWCTEHICTPVQTTCTDEACF